MKIVWNKVNKWLSLPLSMALVPLLVVTFSGWLYFVLIILLSYATSLYIWANVTRHGKGIWLYVLNFLVLYLMIVCGVLFYDWFLEHKLAQFDLDGDTFFSIEEQTAEQVKYMELLVNDVGRHFLLLTGILYSLVATFVLFLIVSISQFLIRRLSKNKSIGSDSKIDREKSMGSDSIDSN